MIPVPAAERDLTVTNVHRLHVGFPEIQGYLHTVDIDKLSDNEHNWQYFNWVFELSPDNPYRQENVSGCADNEQEGRLTIEARLYPDQISEIRVWVTLELFDRCGDSANSAAGPRTAIYGLRPTGRGPVTFGVGNGYGHDWDWGYAEVYTELWYEA